MKHEIIVPGENSRINNNRINRPLQERIPLPADFIDLFILRLNIRGNLLYPFFHPSAVDKIRQDPPQKTRYGKEDAEPDNRRLRCHRKYRSRHKCGSLQAAGQGMDNGNGCL